MRIATWNVNGLRARIDFVRHWLDARQPDLVGLQELKVTEDEFPFDFFSELGYHAAILGQKGWNGVGILSREPVEVVQLGLPDEDDMGSRLIRATFQGIDFTNVYCPNGKDVTHEDFPKKLVWFESLARYFETVDRGNDVVLCGDFNIVPEPIDCWRGDAADGTVFCTDEERQRLNALIELGLVDLYRSQNPDEQKFSWWDYRGGAFHRGMGLRIDLLLGTPGLAERVQNVEIDRDYRKKKDGNTASDHAPVFADLDV